MFDPGSRKALEGQVVPENPRTLYQPPVRRVDSEGRLRYERDLELTQSSGLPAGFAGTPIIKGDLILWRDVFGISALNRRSRDIVWSQLTSTSLNSLLNLAADQDVRSTALTTYSRSSVLEQLS